MKNFDYMKKSTMIILSLLIELMTRLNEAETSIREKGTISADGKKTHQGNVIKLR